MRQLPPVSLLWFVPHSPLSVQYVGSAERRTLSEGLWLRRGNISRARMYVGNVLVGSFFHTPLARRRTTTQRYIRRSSYGQEYHLPPSTSTLLDTIWQSSISPAIITAAAAATEEGDWQATENVSVLLQTAICNSGGRYPTKRACICSEQQLPFQPRLTACNVRRS